MTTQKLDLAYQYRQRAKREKLLRLADVNFEAGACVFVTMTFRENVQDYDIAVKGWSLIEFEDGSTACVSSNYLSYTKPSSGNTGNNGGNTQQSSGTQQSGSTQQSTIDPDLEAKLAALGLVSGPTEKVDPTAGLTEEEIQQKIEDSYNTEFRVNGT